MFRGFGVTGGVWEFKHLRLRVQGLLEIVGACSGSLWGCYTIRTGSYYVGSTLQQLGVPDFLKRVLPFAIWILLFRWEGGFVDLQKPQTPTP